jgi:hypothetical protein
MLRRAAIHLAAEYQRTKAMTVHSPDNLPVDLTTVQCLEATHLTPMTKELLRAADRAPGQGIVSRDMDSAHVLARQGFVTLGKSGDGWTTLAVTAAGRAALASIG